MESSRSAYSITKIGSATLARHSRGRILNVPEIAVDSKQEKENENDKHRHTAVK